MDPTYVPAYLCLADIAARGQSWDEVLKLSGRALELDPSANAVAYEYHAAANLNLHNLAGAEKSGLRAVAIDKDHREPRVHRTHEDPEHHGERRIAQRFHEVAREPPAEE